MSNYRGQLFNVRIAGPQRGQTNLLGKLSETGISQQGHVAQEFMTAIPTKISNWILFQNLNLTPIFVLTVPGYRRDPRSAVCTECSGKPERPALKGNPLAKGILPQVATGSPSSASDKHWHPATGAHCLRDIRSTSPTPASFPCTPAQHAAHRVDGAPRARCPFIFRTKFQNHTCESIFLQSAYNSITKTYQVFTSSGVYWTLGMGLPLWRGFGGYVIGFSAGYPSVHTHCLKLLAMAENCSRRFRYTGSLNPGWSASNSEPYIKTFCALSKSEIFRGNQTMSPKS